MTTTLPVIGGDRLSHRGEMPPPGIYEGVSFDAYVAWPYVNNSGLSKFLRSPQHFVAFLLEDDDSASKMRGTVCHAGILEPDRFEAEYAIGPDVKLNTKIGKDAWEEFTNAHPGKFHVRGGDGNAMLGIRRAIWLHPFAHKLLASEGLCEVCIVWDDEVSGLRCKARIDKLATAYSYVADLKTTTDARPEAFRESAHRYGYFRQAAHNLNGLAKLGKLLDGFAIIAVEPDAPYALVIYEVDHEEIEIAGIELADAMCRMAELIRETGDGLKYPSMAGWPGYGAEPVTLTRPDRIRNREKWAARS